MKLRFSIRDLLWLTLVCAIFLGFAWNRAHRRDYLFFEEYKREKLEAQQTIQLLEQRIKQLKAQLAQPTAARAKVGAK
jgi:hypothetical protein